ncbi:MAG: hypothetical protein DME25_16230 [Verrucomicrobia bacterium]|nr:MAG: hypothetical protein DME25_16230 [Verrucomicrobiota bacterium]
MAASNIVEDLNLLEKANLTTESDFVARNAIIALHYFRKKSRELGIPVEQMTTEQIIEEFARADETIREHKVWLAFLDNRLRPKA